MRQTRRNQNSNRITECQLRFLSAPSDWNGFPPRAAIDARKKSVGFRIEPKAVTDFLMSAGVPIQEHGRFNMLNLESDTVVKQGMRLSPFRPGRREGEFADRYSIEFRGGSVEKGAGPGSPDSVNPEPYYSLVFDHLRSRTPMQMALACPQPACPRQQDCARGRSGPFAIFPIDPASLKDSATGPRWRRPTRSESETSTPTVRQSHHDTTAFDLRPRRK